MTRTPKQIELSDAFTPVPKVRELRRLGLPAEMIPTYVAITDHANNKTGECYPMMQTVARILDRSLRTIQRHVAKMVELGLIELLERRRDKKGRFLGYLFRVAHAARAAARLRERREANKKRYEEKRAREKAKREAKRRARSRRSSGSSTGHGDPMAPNKGTSTSNDLPPKPPRGAAERRTEGYEWFFGLPTDPEKQREHDEEERHRRAEEARRRREGYEWLFGD